MADFDDITGWREELEAFEESEEGQAYFGDAAVDMNDELSFDVVLELAGLMLEHEELRKAVEQKAAFRAFLRTRPDLTNDDDEFWEKTLSMKRRRFMISRLGTRRKSGFPIEAAQIWLNNGGVIPEWVPPTPTPDDVKTEAARRILAVCPEWKQRNLIARAAELAIKGPANWTVDEVAEVESGQALWDSIKSIREASDALETTGPIPNDYTDDRYWLSVG